MNAFKETASTWLFLVFGFVFMAMAYISLPGLRASKFTDNEIANGYIALFIVAICMILLGRTYFVKLKIKPKLKDIISKEAQRRY